jgi:hypothetical protein
MPQQSAEISTLLITLTPYMVIYVDNAIYLGLTVQSNLKWDNHINNICNKGNITLDLFTKEFKHQFRLSNRHINL